MELNEKQKALLENKIYNIIKESFFENDFLENDFLENSFLEKKKKPSKEPKEKKTKKHHNKDLKNLSHKTNLVMKWLDSEQDKHSTIAYRLWPDKDKDQARSDFSKAWRGEDGTEHKEYSFTPEEINKIYNLRNDYIKRGSLDI